MLISTWVYQVLSQQGWVMHSKSDRMGWLGVFLTLLKPAFVWAILALLANQRNGLASVGIFCFMISDVFDGVIFRKSSAEMQRRFGFMRRVVDAVSDRVGIFLVCLAMVKMTNLPFYIYSVELVREVILISIIGYSWMVHRPIVRPNNVSRTATFFTGLTAIAWLNSQEELAIAMIVVTAVVGAVGLAKYYRNLRPLSTRQNAYREVRSSEPHRNGLASFDEMVSKQERASGEAPGVSQK